MTERIRWARVVIAGLAANLASFVVGGGFYVLIGRFFMPEPGSPFWQVLRWQPHLTWEMPAWWWVFLIVGNTVLGIGVAFVYAVLHDGIPGKGAVKGMVFGLLLWIAVLLPVAFTLAVMVKVSVAIAVIAAVEPLIEALAYGAIIGAIYREP